MGDRVIRGGMSDDLARMNVVRRSGHEAFRADGGTTDHTLLDFWRWSSSDLLSNATRGVLAEYIVGLALGCTLTTRIEWDAADLVTPDGVSIEVKSAAYLQTWVQQRVSRITFDIRPTTAWDAATNKMSEARRRQADVYVFALLDHQAKATVDPLDLDQWAFHVLPTAVLNEHAPEQKTIGLARLLALGPESARYGQLGAAVSRAISSE